VKAPTRALTTLAVGFLTLDAVLLVYSGVSLRRPWLAVGGGLCALAAVLVVIAWRRYRRALDELDQARREMREEVKSIRELLHEKHLHN
jgi:membrane protein implicated in regulation of membrane protease activity